MDILILVVLIVVVYVLDAIIKKNLSDSKPVGYCDDDSQCADGYSCIDNKCTEDEPKEH